MCVELGVVSAVIQIPEVRPRGRGIWRCLSVKDDEVLGAKAKCSAQDAH